MLSGTDTRLDANDQVKKNSKIYHVHSDKAGKDNRFKFPLTLIDDSNTSTLPAQKKKSNLELRTLANRTAVYSKQDINKLIPLFEKVISLVLLYRQNNVCNWERIILCLIKNIFGGNIIDVSSIQNIRKCFTDVLRWNCSLSAAEISEHLEENNFDFYFKSISFRIFQETIRWNVTSHVLSSEKMMTIRIPIPRRRHHWTMKTQTSHCSDDSMKSKSSASGDFVARSLVVAENLMDIQKHINCYQMRLLCVFTSNLNFEGSCKAMKKLWATHDVKLLLSKAFNVVISENIITISHENNQEIRIIFRNTLKTIKIDYENQDFPLTKNCNLAKRLKRNKTLLKKNIENAQEEQTSILLNKGRVESNEHEDSNAETNRPVRAETLAEKENQDFLTVKNMNIALSNNNHTINTSSRSKSICQCHLQYLLRKKILLNAMSENSSGISDTASNQDKHKFHTILKKNSRTAFKRVNVKQIVSSAFRHFFHFYSMIGGHLRSGVVITKSNSNYWLIVAGVVTDSRTLKLAEDSFNAIAG